MSRRRRWSCQHCWAESGGFRSSIAATRAWGQHQRWYHPEKWHWLRRRTA